jgi:hypothetical protein
VAAPRACMWHRAGQCLKPEETNEITFACADATFQLQHHFATLGQLCTMALASPSECWLAAGVSEGGQTSAQRVHLCTERTLHRSTVCWPTQAGGPCCGQSPSVPVTEQQTQTKGGAKFSAAEDGSRCLAHRWSVRRTPTKVAHAKHRDRSQAQQRRRLILRTTVGGEPIRTG